MQHDVSLDLDPDELENAGAPKPLVVAETALVDHVVQVLDATPDKYTEKLMDLFLEPEKKLCIGTLCSGSDAVLDVLKASRSFDLFSASNLTPNTHCFMEGAQMCSS